MRKRKKMKKRIMGKMKNKMMNEWFIHIIILIIITEWNYHCTIFYFKTYKIYSNFNVHLNFQIFNRFQCSD